MASAGGSVSKERTTVTRLRASAAAALIPPAVLLSWTTIQLGLLETAKIRGRNKVESTLREATRRSTAIFRTDGKCRSC